MSTQIPSITPAALHAAQSRQQYCGLLDVRTTAEYRAGHIPGALLIPIEDLSLEAVAKAFKRPMLGHEETLYIICHAGPRAQQAAERLQQAGYSNLSLVEGGTLGWEQAGLPLQRCGNAISLERQVQIAVGSLLVAKVVLGFSVHALFFALAALIGVGLIVAGITRWCGMAKLIARMPWNRGIDGSAQVNA
jgi:rhodanese-related sulfurtransferase